MNYNIKEIIEQAREAGIDQKEWEMEAERERKRPRTLVEAQKILSNWKARHKRKTKTNVSISICQDYKMDLDMSFFMLRLFVGNEMESIYILEPQAAKTLIADVPEIVQGGLSFYHLFNNIKPR